MFAKAAAEKHEEMAVESKFSSMAKIVSNPAHYALMLRMCLGGGDSITKSSEVSDEPKEKDEKPGKESRK